MNIRLKNSSFLVMMMLFHVFSCNNNQATREESLVSFSDDWKMDSLGCLGIRRKIIADSSEVFKEFVGMKEVKVTSNLGKPNDFKYRGSQKVLLYWFGCGMIRKDNYKTGAKNKRWTINYNAGQLLIKVDSLSIVESISIIVP